MKQALFIALLLLLAVAPTSHATTRVILLDTGVTPNHPELADRINYHEALTLINDARGIRDCHGHGTAVASIIAGNTIGLAPTAKITPIRILDCTKKTTAERVIKALQHILAKRRAGSWSEPTIINASFTLPQNARIDSLVDQLAKLNIPTIASAGNTEGTACIYSPARANTSITIGAYTSSRGPYWSSNTGRCVDFYAPARRLGATPKTGYKHRTGTSISAAIATGIIARANPDRLTGKQARGILNQHSIRETWGDRLTPRTPEPAQ